MGMVLKENKFNWDDFELCIKFCKQGDYCWFNESDGSWRGYSFSPIFEQNNWIEGEIKNGGYKLIENYFMLNQKGKFKNVFFELTIEQMIIKNLGEGKYDVYYK